MLSVALDRLQCTTQQQHVTQQQRTTQQQHVMQQQLMEQEVEVEDPLVRVHYITFYHIPGSMQWVILTTQHKTPGIKGTHYPNPEIPLPSMPGRGISGLGSG